MKYFWVSVLPAVGLEGLQYSIVHTAVLLSVISVEMFKFKYYFSLGRKLLIIQTVLRNYCRTLNLSNELIT